MYGYAIIPGGINGCCGAAVVNKGKPAGIAVGKDVNGLAVLFPADIGNDGFSILAQCLAERCIFIGYCACRAIDCRPFFCHAVAGGGGSGCQFNGPGKVSCRWSAAAQQVAGCCKVLIKGVVLRLKRCQVHAETGGGPNEPCTPYVHVGYGRKDFFDTVQPFDD